MDLSNELKLFYRPGFRFICGAFLLFCLQISSYSQSVIYLAGFVHNTDASPIPGAQIQLVNIWNDSIYKTSITDSSGFFRFIDVAQQDYRIKIQAAAYPVQWYSPNGNTLYPDYKIFTGPVNIDSMKIKVLYDPVDNSPTSKVTISIYDDTGKQFTGLGSQVMVIRDYDRMVIATKALDSSNTVVIDSLRQGNYAFEIIASPFPMQYLNPTGNTTFPSYFQSIGLKDTLYQNVSLTFTPKGNGHITGQCLLSGTGTPAGQMILSLFRNSDTLNPLYIDTTDNNGGFHFNEIMDGSYYLKITGKDLPAQWFLPMQKRTALYPAESFYVASSGLDTLIITLTEFPLDNTPQARMRLQFRDKNDLLMKVKGSVQLIEVYSRKSSFFSCDTINWIYELKNIATGNYVMQLNLPGYPAQYYSPTGNTQYESYRILIGTKDSTFLYVKPVNDFFDTTKDTSSVITYGSVRGAVTDSLGKPFSKAEITLISSQNIYEGTEITDSLGNFGPIKLRSPNSYYLQIKATGYPLQYWSMYGNSVSMNSNAQFSLMTKDSLTFNIKLSSFFSPPPDTGKDTPSVNILVKTEDGIPVEGALVSLFNASLINSNFSPESSVTPYQGISDINGKVLLTNIPKGEYIAFAKIKGKNFLDQYYRSADQVQNATRFNMDTSNVDLIFSLKKGGVFKGMVTTVTGQPVSAAMITLSGDLSGKVFGIVSDVTGYFELQKIPAGIYSLRVTHNNYIGVEKIVQQYQFIEGQEIVANGIKMEPGAYIKGIYSSEIGDNSTLYRGNLRLFRDTSDISQVTKQMDFFTGISFIQTPAIPLQGTFISNICKYGSYKAIFSPVALSSVSGNPVPQNTIVSNCGWSAINNPDGKAALISVGTSDTVTGYTINIRKGYSVYGQLRNEDGSMYSGQNYSIGAYVKTGDQYYCISNSYNLTNGRFELPGLVDSEEYYFEINADGYPHQYWSGQEKNTNYLSGPWKFSAITGIVPDIALTKNPLSDNTTPIDFYVWVENSSTGSTIVKWNCPSTIAADTFKLYSIDRNNGLQFLSAIPKTGINQSYEYTETRSVQFTTCYTVTAKGNGVLKRGNIAVFNPASVNKKLWLDVFTGKRGIQLQAGYNDSSGLSQSDSLTVYRKSGIELWKLMRRITVREAWFTDDNWTMADSGKIIEYRVEYPGKRIVSEVKSITLDQQFFKQLSRKLNVGPYERYTTIQAAINDAQEYDIITVRSGLYKENINLKGKVLFINGNWESGKPPVIDANGGVAVSVPYTSSNKMKEKVNISGLKIQNAKTGIFTEDEVFINNCLFTGCDQSILCKPDSSKVANASLTDPFISEKWVVNADQCTFIASKNGDLAISAIPGSSYVQSNYSASVNLPLSYIKTDFYSGNNIFAHFNTRAAIAGIPVRIPENSNIMISNCDFYETSVAVTSQGISTEKIYTINPQFTDTTYFFISDTSVLRSATIGRSIGYDQWRLYSNSNTSVPKAVKNITRKVTGIKTVYLKWDPSPTGDKVAYYRIYRVPADTSLFFVNEKSQWELKKPKDSMISVMDTFRTTYTQYTDTTIIPGKEYVYAVAAVDSSQNEGMIELPAPPPLSEYAVNKYQYELKIYSQKWYLMSIWGTESLNISQDNLIVYKWDDTHPQDKLYSQYVKTSVIGPGTGYWFKSSNDTIIKITSVLFEALLKQQDSIRLNLIRGNSGWHQIASPLPFSVSPSWLAETPVWEWNADSSGYKRAYQIEPWKAYWIHVDRDTVLPLRENAPTYSLAKKVSKASWELQISLSGDGVWDPENICGVIQKDLTKNSIGINALEPPQAFGASQLFFVDKCSDFSNQNEIRLSYQYQVSSPVPQKKLEWLVGLSPCNRPSKVEVANVESVPENIFILWIDQDKVVDLRKDQSISIQPHSTTSYGYVVATANIADIAIYNHQFMIRSPYPNPFRTRTVIEYTVPYDWSINGLKKGNINQMITIDLYDMLGRYRGLLFKNTVAAGPHKFIWSGKDNNKREIPSGFYLLRIRCGEKSASTKIYKMR